MTRCQILVHNALVVELHFLVRKAKSGSTGNSLSIERKLRLDFAFACDDAQKVRCELHTITFVECDAALPETRHRRHRDLDPAVDDNTTGIEQSLCLLANEHCERV